MLLSSVVPLQGTDLANAIRVAKSEAEGLSNLSGTRADERLNNYHRWSSQAADQLRHVFDLEQVEPLVINVASGRRGAKVAPENILAEVWRNSYDLIGVSCQFVSALDGTTGIGHSQPEVIQDV